MRVSMDIEKGSVRTGWFSSRVVHQLVVDVRFSHAERAAVRVLGIGDRYVMLFRPESEHDREANAALYPDYTGHRPIFVDHLLAGPVRINFEDRYSAQHAMEEMQSALGQLKSSLGTAGEATSLRFDL